MMRARQPTGVMMIAAAALVMSAPLGLAAGPTADTTRARLEAGEVIVKTTKVRGSEAPRYRVFAVIAATPARVWAQLSECSALARSMLLVTASRRVARKGNTERCAMQVELPMGLGSLDSITEAVNTVIPGERWHREWRLVEGDYEANSGSWTLVPWNEDGTRTLAVYEQHVFAKMVLPASVQRAGQKQRLPEILRKLRRVVE